MKLTIKIKNAVWGGLVATAYREDGAEYGGISTDRSERISAWIDILMRNHDIEVVLDERGQE